jgi:hypothetical protein
MRLEPKGKQSGSGVSKSPDANLALPVYRANLNHPVNVTEHGNAANPVQSHDRTDLTARRVRGRSIGMTEEATPFPRLALGKGGSLGANSHEGASDWG